MTRVFSVYLWLNIFTGNYWPRLFSTSVVCVKADFIIRHPHIYSNKSGDLNFGILLDITPMQVKQFDICNVAGRAQLSQIANFYFQHVSPLNRTSEEMLKNVKFGFVVLGMDEDLGSAISEPLVFLPQSMLCRDKDCYEKRNVQNIALSFRNIVGVVSFLLRDYTEFATAILNVDDIAVASSLSTKELKDKVRFPNFHTFMCEISDLVSEILDAVLKELKWTYFSVVYNYFRYNRIYQDLKKQADRSKLCIAASIQLLPNGNKSGDMDMVSALVKFNKLGARVVVLLLDSGDVERVFKAVSSNTSFFGTSVGNFYWFAATASKEDLKTLTDHPFLNNTAIIAPVYSSTQYNPLEKYKRMVENFTLWFASLRPIDVIYDAWFTELWNRYHCNLSGTTNICSTFNTTIGAHNACVDLDPALNMLAALNIMVEAVRHVIMTNCSNEQLSSLVDCVKVPLADQIEAEIERLQPSSKIIRDLLPQHAIISFRSVEKKLVPIAVYDIVTKSVHNISKAHFSPDSNGVEKVVLSQCGQDCKAHEAQIYIQCCWTCAPCHQNEIVKTIDNSSKCESCPELLWPNERSNFTSCYRIKETHSSLTDTSSHFLIMVSAFFSAIIVGIAVFFVYHRTKLVIKATSLDLSLTMLVGMFLSQVSVVVALMKATNVTCMVSAVLSGMSLFLLHGALLTRSILIYRIFSQQTNMKYFLVSRRSRLGFTSVLVLLDTVFTVLEGPRVLKKQPVLNVKYVEVYCGTDSDIAWTKAIIVLHYTLRYVMLIYWLTLAFRTRHVNANFNESGFIFVCVCAELCIILLSVLLTNSVLRELDKLVLRSTTLVTSQLCYLLFLFFTKIYAVFFERNVKLRLNKASSGTSFSLFRSRSSISIPHHKRSFMLSSITLQTDTKPSFIAVDTNSFKSDAIIESKISYFPKKISVSFASIPNTDQKNVMAPTWIDASHKSTLQNLIPNSPADLVGKENANVTRSASFAAFLPVQGQVAVDKVSSAHSAISRDKTGKVSPEVSSSKLRSDVFEVSPGKISKVNVDSIDPVDTMAIEQAKVHVQIIHQDSDETTLKLLSSDNDSLRQGQTPSDTESIVTDQRTGKTFSFFRTLPYID